MQMMIRIDFQTGNFPKSRRASRQSTTGWSRTVRNFQVGYKTDIGAFTYINAKYGVTIEDFVQIGSHCSIYSVSTIDEKTGPVLLKKNCRVGSHSVVMPGVTIGENAVVGAFSFVNRDIPANAVADGVPVKIIKPIPEGALKTPLTINGLSTNSGQPVREHSFSAWPHYEEDEVAAAMLALQSGQVNYWTGQEGRKFEDEYAAFVGTNYAVALMNGSVALEAALVALGMTPGDEIVVTSRTFIASASCVIMRGGRPVMADVDPVSQNITAETIAAALTPRTKGIIVVHLAGWPCDMDPIMNLAREKGLWVVEDCAQANGATYKGRQVGSIGDVAAFSFCQDKIITTGGEGGMVTTKRHDIWDKVWSYKDHGKSFDAVYHREHPPGFRWLHESFGTNWRMTEMQAAIGRVQLRKLPQWLTLRRRNAAVLTDGFSRIPGLRLTIPPQEIEHAYYKYYVFVEPEALKSDWSRDRIMTALMAEGIPCGSGSCSEIYLEKAFDQGALRPKDRLPVAKQLGETSLMFMVHPTLSADDMEDVVRAMDKVMRVAIR